MRVLTNNFVNSSDRLDYWRMIPNKRAILGDKLVLSDITDMTILEEILMDLQKMYPDLSEKEKEIFDRELNIVLFKYKDSLFRIINGKGFFQEMIDSNDNDVWPEMDDKIKLLLQMLTRLYPNLQSDAERDYVVNCYLDTLPSADLDEQLKELRSWIKTDGESDSESDNFEYIDTCPKARSLLMKLGKMDDDKKLETDPFIIYSKKNKERVKWEYGNSKRSEIRKILMKQWLKLEDKSKYIKLADKNRDKLLLMDELQYLLRQEDLRRVREARGEEKSEIFV